MRNQYATMSDFESMTLEQIEKTLEKYLAIAEGSDWDITPDFERDLTQLTRLAKAKGSKRQW